MTNKTYFIDIDGTLLTHLDNFADVTIAHCYRLKDEIDSYSKDRPIIRDLPGVVDTLVALHTRGDKVILTTGRPENLRETTQCQLSDLGIIYDQLIMGCGSGPRILINDVVVDPVTRKSAPVKAMCHNTPRNEGFTLKQLDNIVKMYNSYEFKIEKDAKFEEGEIYAFG